MVNPRVQHRRVNLLNITVYVLTFKQLVAREREREHRGGESEPGTQATELIVDGQAGDLSIDGKGVLQLFW